VELRQFKALVGILQARSELMAVITVTGLEDVRKSLDKTRRLSEMYLRDALRREAEYLTSVHFSAHPRKKIEVTAFGDSKRKYIDGVQKSKCAHCGQYAEPETECHKCGAPVDPEE
jgi:hypothetical protein